MTMGMVLVAARAALMADGPTAIMTSGFVATSSVQSRKARDNIIGGEDVNAEIASFHKPKLRQFREVQLTQAECAELIAS